MDQTLYDEPIILSIVDCIEERCFFCEKKVRGSYRRRCRECGRASIITGKTKIYRVCYREIHEEIAPAYTPEWWQFWKTRRPPIRRVRKEYDEADKHSQDYLYSLTVNALLKVADIIRPKDFVRRIDVEKLKKKTPRRLYLEGIES
jgi:ribosomal protein S14